MAKPAILFYSPILWRRPCLTMRTLAWRCLGALLCAVLRGAGSGIETAAFAHTRPAFSAQHADT